MRSQIILALISLSLDVLALHPRCQSEDRCFYNTPSFWRQNHPDLENYVGQQFHIDGYEDQGLCVPTAGAILLKGVLDERHRETKLNSAFLEGYNDREWYKNVYQIGIQAKTNFKKGGTWPSRVYHAYKDYFKNTNAKIGLVLNSQGNGLGFADVTNQEVIDSIKDKKVGYLIGVDKRIKKTKSILGVKQTWYDRDVGHALVIKGFDADRLQIHDPWGYQYFVRIKREFFKRNRFGLGNEQSIFQSVDSIGSGWMNGKNQNTNTKFVLDELIGLSLD